MSQPIRSSRGSALARRLRDLREHRWPDQNVTQKHLADALGGLSVGTISGYENERNPTTPPTHRLRSYSSFFATRRSLENGRPRLLRDADLDAGELAERDRLFNELQSLAAEQPDRESASVQRRTGIWTFPEHEPVRIVCGHLTGMTHPYADPKNSNHTELLTFADLDSMAELWGHLRMINPTCDVRFLRADELYRSDDLSSHLVLLGGNGLNPAVQRIVSLTDLPVRQADNQMVPDGDVFSIDSDFPDALLPVRTGDLGLVQDTGLFARTPNPYNSARTLTLCSGVYSRGVYGSVRTLTDAMLRDRNEKYLAERFADLDRFAILMRVQVLRGNATTPDLGDPDVRLYEWPEAVSEGTTETGDRGTGAR